MKRQQRGQGMTEYIIIVALIGIAAMGVYSLYGRTARAQQSAIAAAVGGDATLAKDANKSGKTSGGMATVESAAAIGLDNFSEPSSTK